MMNSPEIEVSVVIPCLDEADTLASALQKAKEGVEPFAPAAEIIVADNASSDGSGDIALQHGAKVVHVSERGYGSALMGGIAAARGRYIIMGDADNSHDLKQIPVFVEKLREGFDLVQGCRLPSGGGTVAPGSMSFVRRRFGNPLFSLMVRRWFGVPVHDVNCGFRGFTKDLYDRLDQRCTGMEFAPEMIAKAGLAKARIAEVPIHHDHDGRVSHAPHNRAIRDGWRTLRFLLMYSPRWLFLIPGICLFVLGILVYALSLTFREGFALTQASVLAGLLILCGYQSILFAFFAKVFAIRNGLLPEDPKFEKVFEVVNLERGLALAAIAITVGAAFLTLGLLQTSFWRFEATHFTFLGATALALGFQTVLSGFFLSILGLKQK